MIAECPNCKCNLIEMENINNTWGGNGKTKI